MEDTVYKIHVRFWIPEGKEMHKKKVSIIIPTYNRASTIKRAIDSVLNQTYSDFELIVVDDGSTDNTAQVVNEYEDSRLRYLKIEDRHGANHARNVGIENADGEYIAFQDSDDEWHMDKLEKQMKILLEQKQVDIVFSRCLRHCIDGRQILVPNKNYSECLLQEKIESILAEISVIGTPTLIIRKKCFQEEGAFDEAISRYQDWEIMIRFSQKYKIFFLDEVLVELYEMKESISNEDRSYVKGRASIVKKHKDFFRMHNMLDKHIGNVSSVAACNGQLEELLNIWGEELFIQGQYACINKYTNMQKNYIFVQEWIKQEKNARLVNDFLAKFADRTVAIYGLGDLGKLMIAVLSNENRKKIKYIIDQRISIASEYTSITPEQLHEQDYERIECIVITAIAHEEEIKKKLGEITMGFIVSLYDIIFPENL